MVGGHCLKTWSKMQGLIAKSSAEAELYGAVNAASEALVLEDVGEHYNHGSSSMPQRPRSS
eukprot:2069299-Lingulodinium_polyedra.AAC.1